jgi:hypothetical protein
LKTLYAWRRRLMSAEGSPLLEPLNHVVQNHAASTVTQCG